MGHMAAMRSQWPLYMPQLLPLHTNTPPPPMPPILPLPLITQNRFMRILCLCIIQHPHLSTISQNQFIMNLPQSTISQNQFIMNPNQSTMNQPLSIMNQNQFTISQNLSIMNQNQFIMNPSLPLAISNRLWRPMCLKCIILRQQPINLPTKHPPITPPNLPTRTRARSPTLMNTPWRTITARRPSTRTRLVTEMR